MRSKDGGCGFGVCLVRFAAVGLLCLGGWIVSTVALVICAREFELARVAPHTQMQRLVRLQRRGIDADRLPLQQIPPGQQLQPSGTLLDAFAHRSAAACATSSNDRAVSRSVHAQKTPQRQRIRRPPRNPALAVYAFGMPAQQQAEIPTRRQTRPSHFLRIEAGTLRGRALPNSSSEFPALPVFGNVRNPIGRDFDEVIHIPWSEAYTDEIVARFRHTLAKGEPHIVPERIEERRDRGVREIYEWQINRIPLPEGGYGVVCYFRDVSPLRHQTQHLVYIYGEDLLFSNFPSWVSARARTDVGPSSAPRRRHLAASAF